MLDSFTAVNDTDEDGHPTGGYVAGNGLTISWQNGPLGRGDDRLPPNGAFVETVIDAAKQRIQFYNENGFGCVENDVAIFHLNAALAVLNERTARRERQGVEGTHVGS